MLIELIVTNSLNAFKLKNKHFFYFTYIFDVIICPLPLFYYVCICNVIIFLYSVVMAFFYELCLLADVKSRDTVEKSWKWKTKNDLYEKYTQLLLPQIEFYFKKHIFSLCFSISVALLRICLMFILFMLVVGFILPLLLLVVTYLDSLLSLLYIQRTVYYLLICAPTFVPCSFSFLQKAHHHRDYAGSLAMLTMSNIRLIFICIFLLFPFI